ncbi:acyl carrier protein [Candidatus Pantoea bituminis]|uniref:acyl carrier protein n=1 Tax=Candidatus Pantoea bituminis TaxID=2831036 RepID=UPI001C060812|nr:acyl carrier protein [Pantoea bituminis]
MSETNEIENVILSIWKNVLNKDVINPSQDLITLGGQSLDALKIASECQKCFQTPVTMVMVLRYRTVSGLAKALAAT